MIELKSNSYCEFEEGICINKNITIEGQTEKNEQNQTVLPTIAGIIFIKDSAKVVLKNLYIQTKKDKFNTLNVRGKSTLIATNLVIENTEREGTNYPIVYIDENSLVNLNDSLVRQSKIHDSNHRIYVENSTLNINNSTLNAKLYISRCKSYL